MIFIGGYMARSMKCLILAILFIIICSSPLYAIDSAKTNQGVQPLKILNITPSGDDVPAGRQIVFQFNSPVVPVGRMDRKVSEVPITITPEVQCQWRWLNTSALACMLDEKSALTPATRYDIVIRPGITSEDGATIKETVKHSFTTERPMVEATWSKTWEAPGMPVVRVIFNQPVSQESVERHLFMRLQGQAQSRIQVNVSPEPDDQDVPLILPLPGEKLALITSPGQQGQSEKKQETGSQINGIEARKVWLVSPKDELPLDSAIDFSIEPGLESALGPEKGVEDRIFETFFTFPSFTFLGIQCIDNNKVTVLIEPGKASVDQCLCNPVEGISLVFSSPVINKMVKEHVIIKPDLADGQTDYDTWADEVDYLNLNSPHVRDQKYNIRIPGSFKANQVYRIKGEPDKFYDEFGRTLVNPIDIQFATDHLRSYFGINSQAVLEKDVDTDMPLAVTNLDNLIFTYDRLTAKGKDTALKQEITPPKVKDSTVQIPSRVRKMLGGQSGVVQGTITSTPSVSKPNNQDRFFAQVTPFQVHVKVGYFNTMVWVTDLATGKPVSGAAVKLYQDKYKGLSPNPEILASTITDSEGTSVLDGTEKIDPELDLINAYNGDNQRLFLRVEKDEDIALLPLGYEFNVNAFETSIFSIETQMRRQYGHIHAWGATAQGVYRAGDTIRYKLYVRNQSNETFIPAPRDGYALKIVDPMRKTVHEVKDIVLSEFGAYQGEFTVPDTGAMGWYQFQLSASFFKSGWEPMKVLVSDFTTSPFKVTMNINGRNYQPGDKMEVTTQARLHDGGPYPDASARVAVTIKGDVCLCSEDPIANGFIFNTYVPGSETEQILNQAEGKLDKKGNLITDIILSESKVLFGELMVESAVRDDRGKYIAARTTAKYASRDRFVGLRLAERRFTKDKPGNVDILVVDANGKPVAGIPVSLKVERREILTSGKGAGITSLNHSNEKWTEVESRMLESESRPISFQFTASEVGYYRITALIQDSKGREHSTELEQWVMGKESLIWRDDEKNNLEIIPEKTGYKVGETARYTVQNPFPGARALVTIERYGVLKHWVQTLDTANPVIEFKVEKDFAPGYFFSIVVMSPRTAKPSGVDQEDPGKPAFHIGYVETTVTDSGKELNVEVKPEKETYKPGDRVKVDLHVNSGQDNTNEPVELAMVVLDEEVLDLISGGSDYFDPYKGFYTLDGLDMKNFNLLMHLVDRRNIERQEFTLEEKSDEAMPTLAKYAPEITMEMIGDSGVDLSMRSVFKFVSYWNPSIIPDAQGRASIEFDVPDNLTGWRILVMAVTPSDKMGLSEEHFAVNRQTEILPVMPNQVTEGDKFKAGFSIMNRTDKTRDLTMTITASGAIETQAGQGVQQITQTVNAEPYIRSTVWLPLTAKGDGKIKFTANGGDASDQDGVVHELEVRKMTSLETAATYGSSVSDNIAESIKFPDNIRTDVGKVYVTLSPSVTGNVEGAFKYLRDYPYICWEQILTKGIMASHYQNLKRYMSDEFTWEGSKDLTQAMLDQAGSYQAPNGGMVYYTPEDRYTDPYLSAYTALAFNWLRDSGYKMPSAVEDKLHEFLITMLRKDVTPDFYSKGMASTVRAVALAALTKSGKITIEDLRRYQPYLKEMDLFGKAHFLMAAIGIKGAEDMRKEVFNMILSHADQTSGKFVFNEAFDDSCSRILTSSLRTNAAVLSALVAYGRTEEGKAIAGDIPFKMARYITQTRKQSGRWENTQENMFCMNALIDYSRAYESEKPAMTVTARLDKETMGEAKFKDVRDNPVELKRPIEKTDPGHKAKVTIEREGQGRLYYSVGLSYAPLKLNADSINAGIDIRREYSVERNGKWMLLQSPMEIKRGELVRVDLYVSLPAARNFVVVDDPVPGGLEPVNRDLATSSTVDADKAESDYAADSWWFHFREWSYYGMSRWSFYHQELRHHAVRFYSEYLAAGNYHLSYTAQAIAPGEFTVMPTHAEEMYDPDVFGKGSAAILNVSLEQGK